MIPRMNLTPPMKRLLADLEHGPVWRPGQSATVIEGLEAEGLAESELVEVRNNRQIHHKWLVWLPGHKPPYQWELRCGDQPPVGFWLKPPGWVIPDDCVLTNLADHRLEIVSPGVVEDPLL